VALNFRTVDRTAPRLTPNFWTIPLSDKLPAIFKDNILARFAGNNNADLPIIRNNATIKQKIKKNFF